MKTHPPKNKEEKAERLRAYLKIYRLLNREKILQYKRRWSKSAHARRKERERNRKGRIWNPIWSSTQKEKRQSSAYKVECRRYYLEHKAHILKTNKSYRKNNPDKLKKCQKNWSQRNPHSTSRWSLRKQSGVRMLPEVVDEILLLRSQFNRISKGNPDAIEEP